MSMVVEAVDLLFSDEGVSLRLSKSLRADQCPSDELEPRSVGLYAGNRPGFVTPLGEVLRWDRPGAESAPPLGLRPQASSSLRRLEPRLQNAKRSMLMVWLRDI
jgi:hypothetical protein